jgi:hypothetical protein
MSDLEKLWLGRLSFWAACLGGFVRIVAAKQPKVVAMKPELRGASVRIRRTRRDRTVIGV